VSPSTARRVTLTRLDAQWDQAPFEDHDALVDAVAWVAAEWRNGGLIGEGEHAEIVGAARRVEGQLGG
jgi:hypothetical protein